MLETIIRLRFLQFAHLIQFRVRVDRQIKLVSKIHIYHQTATLCIWSFWKEMLKTLYWYQLLPSLCLFQKSLFISLPPFALNFLSYFKNIFAEVYFFAFCSVSSLSRNFKSISTFDSVLSKVTTILSFDDLMAIVFIHYPQQLLTQEALARVLQS